ncbi:MAG: tryptophan--tRNA ligase [bacterium]|nr:tryptophan--tRNA ligase [bacterium]
MKLFSGMRPSGQLHIGNYLGALKNWVELQKKHQCIFSAVDYHAITTPFNPKRIHEAVKNLVLDYLAAGVDPKKSIIIVQSQIPEHTELAWILEAITPVSWLERIPTYKEKLELHPKHRNLGILAYPVLMAADILLYKATLVPVGDDQMPHIEITNDLARRFNQMFGKTFPPVKGVVNEGMGARIMSLTDPTKKMSKTGGEGIALTDSPETIREKIKTAVTDSGREVKFDEKNKPAISNFLTIHHLFSGKTIAELEKKYHNKGYAEFKNDLSEVIIKGLADFQEKRKELEKNPKKVEKILADGAKRAQKIAEQNIKEVKIKMGLL